MSHKQAQEIYHSALKIEISYLLEMRGREREVGLHPSLERGIYKFPNYQRRLCIKEKLDEKHIFTLIIIAIFKICFHTCFRYLFEMVNFIHFNTENNVG